MSSRFRLLRVSLAVLLPIVPATFLTAQVLEIKLIDGRNGRPLVGTSSYVNVWVGGKRKEAIAIPTDSSGVARLKLTLSPNEVNVPNSTHVGTIVTNHPVVEYAEILGVNVPYVICGADGAKNSPLELKNFITKEIVDHGYASANTCGKITVLPKPGQIVLFVRPLTLVEKMKQ